MKIALIVDNPFRDLPGLVLTALELARRGATCLFVPASLKNGEIWSLAPDFVLLNNLRIDKAAFARQVLAAGMGLGILDTEGGVFPSLGEYQRDFLCDPEVLRQVSCFCSWGPRLAEFAVQSGWFSSRQVAVTGVPRLDFYAEPWRQAALTLTAAAGSFPPPMVLLNSNFSLANPLFRTPEEAVQGKIRLWNRDEAIVRRELEIERCAMDELVALAHRLAGRLPGVTLIYRPHPFENPDTYRPLLAGHPNLHLVKQGPVDGWILRACAVIQRGCATAIEAGMAGRPALAPSWIPAAHDLKTVESVSIPCPTEDDVVEQIRHPHVPDNVRANLQGVLSDWFHAIDGLAHQRVADAVLTSANGASASLDYCSRAAHHSTEAGDTWTRRARASLLQTLRLGPDFSFRKLRHTAAPGWDVSQRAFTAGDVRAIVQALGGSAQIQTAEERGCYHFHYASGRSIVLSLA